MVTKTIHAFTAITSIDAADEILAWDDSASTTRKITWANALTNATLVTPTIASFANAQHTHANASGGGTLTGYLAATGATTGATSQAQTFTNGIIGPSWKPASDSTSSVTVYASNGTTQMMRIDSTNNKVAFFDSPTAYTNDVIAVFAGTQTGGINFVVNNKYSAAADLTGDAGILFQLANANAATLKAVKIEDFTSAANRSAAFVFSCRWDGTFYERLRLMPEGFNAFGGHTTAPTAVADLAGSTTTGASVRIRDGTAPTSPNAGDIWNDGALSFYNADATTNAIVNHLRLSRDSTGTAAAGLGLGILAELESTTTSRQSAGRLTWEWDTATHASRAAKGKLTAYYTSTEREAITWTANSAGATVYVNPAGGGVSVGDTTSPGVSILRLGGTIGGAGGAGLYIDPTTNAAAGTQYGLRILGNPANATDFIGLGIHGSVNLTNYRNSIWVGNESGRPGINIGYDYNVAAPEKGLIMAGKLGVGVSSPQSILHGHDGSGGFLFVNRASVGGTLVTVIPDAAGDVTEKIFFVGWCTNSAPFSADVAPTTLTVSSSTTKTDGVNTLTIAVTAGGAFTLQATAGAATWNVNLWVFWR